MRVSDDILQWRASFHATPAPDLSGPATVTPFTTLIAQGVRGHVERSGLRRRSAVRTTRRSLTDLAPGRRKERTLALAIRRRYTAVTPPQLSGMIARPTGRTRAWRLTVGSIFVSHRGSDTGLAVSLATSLRAAGHNVWLDEWNIAPGDSIVERIDVGLTTSVDFVVCLSAAGVNSPWMSREWMAALARKLNGIPLRIIPVKFAPSSGPAILADIKTIDLFTDWDRGLQQLLTILK